MKSTKGTVFSGPTSLTEMARLSGDFADWHNLIYKATWIDGPLDLAAVRDAWWRVCMRHDVMRRTYASPDEATTHADALSEVDLRTAESDDEAVRIMTEILGKPFDLYGPGFSRIVVVRRSDRRHLLGIVVDHIISDQQSWARLRMDFSEQYERTLTGEPGGRVQSRSYQSFATRQREELSGRWGDNCRQFWTSYTRQFGDYPPPLVPVADNTGDLSVRVVERKLPPHIKAQVYRLAQAARATPFAVTASSVLAGMQQVTERSLVGLTTNQHGRIYPGTSETLGLFVQTVPLHLRGRETETIEAIRQVFLRSLNVFEYSVPLRWLGEYWNEDLVSLNRQAGIYFSLVEDSSSALDLPPLTGTVAEDVRIRVPGGMQWPETVVLEWNLQDDGGHLMAVYNEKVFSRGMIDDLLLATERFVLPEDGLDR